MPTRAFETEKFTAKNSTGADVECSRINNPNCTRLAHDGFRVLALHSGKGVTTCKHTLFAGTISECEDEIARLRLQPLVTESKRATEFKIKSNLIK